MMKFKPNQTRTYDGEGFKRRAACLCFHSEAEDEVRPGPRVVQLFDPVATEIGAFINRL